MSQLISLTATQRKSQSTIDWSNFAQTIVIDTQDISTLIRRDTINNVSYFSVNPVKSTENVAKNSSLYDFRVTDTLNSIAAQSTNLFVAAVTSRRGVTVSYSAVFIVSRISQFMEVAGGGGASTRFWYIEDGDTLPVEYVVNASLTNIIAQTNASTAVLVRNGISIAGGYIELGANPLIHNTSIDIDQYSLSLTSSQGLYTTSYLKEYDYLQNTIDDGAGNIYDYFADPTRSTYYGIKNGTFDMRVQLDPTNGFNIISGPSKVAASYFKVNQANTNRAGLIESPPTYLWTPSAAGTDRIIGVKVTTGEFFNTGIDPDSLAPKASPVFTGNPTAPTQATGDNDTSIATTAFVQDAISKKPEVIQIAITDETTPITAGTNKFRFRMPFAMTLTSVRASLNTAQVANGGGGIFTIDINENGVTILSTKLTVDNTEKTSTTALTPPVISDTSLADDSEIEVDVDQIGDGSAVGLKLTLIGSRT